LTPLRERCARNRFARASYLSFTPPPPPPSMEEEKEREKEEKEEEKE